MLSVPLLASLLASSLPAGDLAPSLSGAAIPSLAKPQIGASLVAPDFGADLSPGKTFVLSPAAARVRGAPRRLAEMPIAKPNPDINYTLLVEQPKSGIDYKMIIIPRR